MIQTQELYFSYDQWMITFANLNFFFQSKWMSNTPEGIIDVHLEQIKNSVGSYFERNQEK